MIGRAGNMKIAIFLNSLESGGTEKAACRWARGLKKRNHDVTVLALADGPRRAELEAAGVPLKVIHCEAQAIAAGLREAAPEVIHAHVPGQPQPGDVLGDAFKLLPKIPVVQTNVFGRLENPREDAWTDFRLFVSWTSCVQAARRSYRKLDGNFFRRASVAVYPLDPAESPAAAETAVFRRQLGVADDEVLFGRLSRPDPVKWTNLALAAFQKALQKNRKLKLLLREPPPAVAEKLRASPDARHFIILPVTPDAGELRRTVSALDVVLHTSHLGESFGYGLAEPMSLGRPAITHSVPWYDQAQIELARHGECGFVACTPAAMAEAILKLAGDAGLRARMGAQARAHIRTLANPDTSVARLEAILLSAVERRDNPFAAEDLMRARTAAAYLDAHQFGHNWLEGLTLYPFYYYTRFHEFRNRHR